MSSAAVLIGALKVNVTVLGSQIYKWFMESVLGSQIYKWFMERLS